MSGILNRPFLTISELDCASSLFKIGFNQVRC
jgi:hypothetical protein